MWVQCRQDFDPSIGASREVGVAKGNELWGKTVVDQHGGHVAADLVVPNRWIWLVKRDKSIRITDKLFDVWEIGSRRVGDLTDCSQHTRLHIKQISEWGYARFNRVTALVDINYLNDVLIVPYESWC